jgi:hypothetical protein
MACRVPPLPPGLQGVINVSASPDMQTHASCRPVPFLLSEPLATSVSVERATVTGGINVTVTGQDFGLRAADLYCRWCSCDFVCMQVVLFGQFDVYMCMRASVYVRVYTCLYIHTHVHTHILYECV